MENTQNQENLEPFVPKCSWKPLRGNVQCNDPVVVSYGNVHYCKRHSTSMQAKLKKVEYNSQIEMEKLKSQLNAREHEGEQIQSDLSQTQGVQNESQPEVLQGDEEIVNVQSQTQQTQTFPVVENSEITDVGNDEEPLEEYVEEPRKPRYIIVKKDIYKNEFGHFEDPETNIVFDPARKCAYARIERPSGRLYKLTRKDCKICEQRKWRYVDFYPNETKAKKDSKAKKLEEAERKEKSKKSTKKTKKTKILEEDIEEVENIEDIETEEVDVDDIEENEEGVENEEIEDENVEIDNEENENVEIDNEENEEGVEENEEENLEVEGEEEADEAEYIEDEPEPEPVKKNVSSKPLKTVPVVAKVTPNVIPKVTPKVIPKVTPKVIPKVIPKVTPKVVDKKGDVEPKIQLTKEIKKPMTKTPIKTAEPIKKVVTPAKTTQTKTPLPSKTVRKTK